MFLVEKLLGFVFLVLYEVVAGYLTWQLSKSCESYCDRAACLVKTASTSILIATMCIAALVPVFLIVYTKRFRPKPKRPRSLLPKVWALTRVLWFALTIITCLSIFQSTRVLCGKSNPGVTVTSAVLVGVSVACMIHIQWSVYAWGPAVHGPVPKREKIESWSHCGSGCKSLFLLMGVFVELFFSVYSFVNLDGLCERGCSNGTCAMVEEARAVLITRSCSGFTAAFLLVLSRLCFRSNVWTSDEAVARSLLYWLWIFHLVIGWFPMGIGGGVTLFTIARFLCSDNVATVQFVGVGVVVWTALVAFVVTLLEPDIQRIIKGGKGSKYHERLIETEVEKGSEFDIDGSGSGSEDEVMTNMSVADEVVKRTSSVTTQ